MDICIDTNILIKSLWPYETGHQPCKNLLFLSQSGRIGLKIPAVCIAEAVARIPQKVKECSKALKEAKKALRNVLSEEGFQRHLSQFFVGYFTFISQIRKDLSKELQTLIDVRMASVIPTDAAAIQKLTVVDQKAPDLTWQDKLVLATVLANCPSNTLFLSADSHFHDMSVKELATAHGIQLEKDASSIEEML